MLHGTAKKKKKLCDAAKAVFKGKYRALRLHWKRKTKPQFMSLNFIIKKQEKEGQVKPEYRKS